MGMNALTAEFLSSGFRVLGFPCNNFDMLEPGANASEILNGLTWVRPGNGFVPNFQLFKKIDVNGKNEHKLYTYLKSMCPPVSDEFEDGLFYDPIKVSDVRWNYEVFLINKMGLPVYRYSPDHDVMTLEPDIKGLINTPIQTFLEEEHDHDETPEHIAEVPEVNKEELEEMTNSIE